MTGPEWISVTLKVIDALDALAVPYFIGGSVASMIHGVLRSTIDADLVAEMSTEHVQSFASALSGDFYVEPQSIYDAISLRTIFNLIHQATMFKIDIFILCPLDIGWVWLNTWAVRTLPVSDSLLCHRSCLV